MKVTATRDIEIGEEVFISYLDTEDAGFDGGLPVKERREYLLKNYGFVCKCDMCSRQAPRGQGEGGGHGYAVGSRVIINGLKAKPESNGLRGVVLGYLAGNGRVSVLMDHGNKLSLKPENLGKAENG